MSIDAKNKKDLIIDGWERGREKGGHTPALHLSPSMCNSSWNMVVSAAPPAHPSADWKCSDGSRLPRIRDWPGGNTQINPCSL